MPRHFSFAPGDVLSTGSPSGVGVARTPPVFRHPGDEVSVAVDRIGVLGSTVVVPAGGGAGTASRGEGRAHA